MSSVAGPELWIVRHGETEWSRDGRHTSTTDLALTPVGEEAATALAPRLANPTGPCLDEPPPGPPAAGA